MQKEKLKKYLKNQGGCDKCEKEFCYECSKQIQSIDSKKNNEFQGVNFNKKKVISNITLPNEYIISTSMVS